jgi:folate-dependent phosphoribosylglycinamide formyltransferase PurN
MHVVVFGSGSGTNLEALLRAQRELRTSLGNPLFEVKALCTDRLCRFHEIAERERLPLIHNPFVKFCKEQGIEDAKNLRLRAAYDQRNVQLLEACAQENHFFVDLIFLAGYMRLLHTPILARYFNKILNVHPADLTLMDEGGRRKYVGANAVFDALMNGETRTRSSVILIDENVDTGPILVSGPWLPYTEGQPVTFKRAEYHQDKQKTFSDWRACIKAVELIAEGRFAIDENKQVYFDGTSIKDKGGYLLDS